MDPRDLISSLEARAEQDDMIVLNLIAALKERAVAAAELEQIAQRHQELRTARAGVIVEAAFSLHHVEEAAASRHLHAMFGMVQP